MTIDKQKLKALAERAVEDYPLFDHSMACAASAVLALIADIERLESEAMYSAAGFESDREQIDQLKAENEALRNALGDLLALYEDDEGCRNLPEYIAGRAAMAKEANRD